MEPETPASEAESAPEPETPAPEAESAAPEEPETPESEESPQPLDRESLDALLEEIRNM